MILLIDNYDSFVFNLARYFELAGHETQIFRNDAISVQHVFKLKPEVVVISPGPCTPDEAGISLALTRECAGRIPILGICLGHQVIASAFGGNVIKAKHPMHGSSSAIRHNQQGIFEGLPNPLQAGRYHSLIVEADSLPNCLEVIAHSDQGDIMAIQHKQFDILGLQFHPESILTSSGHQIIKNYCGKTANVEE